MASDWYDEDTDLDDDSVNNDEESEKTIPEPKQDKQQKLEVRRKLEDRMESKRLKNLIDDFYDFDLDEDLD